MDVADLFVEFGPHTADLLLVFRLHASQFHRDAADLLLQVHETAVHLGAQLVAYLHYTPRKPAANPTRQRRCRACHRDK